jgi:hypothetical protein
LNHPHQVESEPVYHIIWDARKDRHSWASRDRSSTRDWLEKKWAEYACLI